MIHAGCMALGLADERGATAIANSRTYFFRTRKSCALRYSIFCIILLKASDNLKNYTGSKPNLNLIKKK
ncbi:hypothetical protein BJF95_18550 [Rhizobium oryziradicis]|uniref:Uncharacterized protein n=1 Tax=Rhizobium oryziradicis TaxID=1867956 RepID=A0A1Q8ZTP4_9HYPH|nr:hypothetical protein BJF95_18550 [Rhizobium oryziradicis]